MRSYRLIFLLFLTILWGCDDGKIKQLEQEKEQLHSTVVQLSKELEDYKGDAAAAWQKEYQFRQNLDAAAACQLVFNLPVFCPPSLAAARSEILDQANKNGISAIAGNRYWLTFVLTACGLLLVLLAGIAGVIFGLGPSRRVMQERAQKIEGLQAELDKFDQAMRNQKSNLSSLDQQIQQRELYLASLNKSIAAAEVALLQATAAAEKAEADAIELEKNLALLKAFRKA
jgi:septal ring factor EnvC (AmiA/AmiB activator)